MTDPRNVRTGWNIPTSTYCDQPYVVKTDDGAWLCVVTTGAGHEGEPGQHVTSMRSTDCGQTWSAPVPVEPAGGPEASYAVMLKVPGGRIYCFYNHNTDRHREVKMETGTMATRVDSLGYYVFKYSDDHGRTWSAKRYAVPVREFECDRLNTYGGKVRFFWNVGRPIIHQKAAVFTLHKVGAFGEGFLAQSEGVFLRSENILTERDPEKIVFATFPEGDIGLRAPTGGGRIAEEHCAVTLSNGTIYCVYRTVAGHPVNVTSGDGGRSWTAPAYMRYGPAIPGAAPARSRLVKHPRAATFVWRCRNGKYLYWFHNHGGRIFRGDPAQGIPKADPYNDRNPVFISGGVERENPAIHGQKTIEWSEPEILLYDDDPLIRMSYPDMVEEGDAYYFTETQKAVARTHKFDATLFEGLWSQLDGGPRVRPEGAALALSSPMPAAAPMPALRAFVDRDWSRADYGSKRTRAGATISFTATLDPTAQLPLTLLDSRRSDGCGLVVRAIEGDRAEITLSDGRTTNSWASDVGTLPRGKTCAVAAIIDSGPGVILWVIDGVLCDGGDQRQFGWGRISPNLQHVNGDKTLRIAPDGGVQFEYVEIHTRALRVSELVLAQRPS